MAPVTRRRLPAASWRLAAGSNLVRSSPAECPGTIEGEGRVVLIDIRRLIAILACVVLASILATSSASANTTVDFRATFPERFGVACPDPPSLCSRGEVVGLGYVEEVARFNACGPNCNLRTLTFADGSKLVLQESTGPGAPPDGGNSFNPNSNGNPVFFPLAGTVRGDLSTGDFAGATGTYSGTATVAGGVAVVRLSGSITLAS
jgi:hypothetical protein